MATNENDESKGLRPGRKRRGAPKKGEGVPWAEVETLYVTTLYSCQQLADKYDVSHNAVLNHCSEGDWVRKRRRYQNERGKRTTAEIQRHQIKTVTQEVESVSALAQGVMQRLAQKLAAKYTKTVKCPCGCGHEFETEIPHTEVTVSDLVQLLKVRSHLKGDPEFVVRVEKEDIPEELKKMSKDELEEKLKATLIEAEAIVLGDDD